MHKLHDSLLSADGRTPLALTCWEADEPQGLVVLVHGMVEYIERYDGFATALADAGLTVVGGDLLGHGASVLSTEEWGHYEPGKGVELLLADVGAVCDRARKHHGGELPCFLFGHSMGSFIVRCSIARPDNGFAGCIVCGTGEPGQALSRLGNGLSRTIGLLRGPRYRSTLVNKLGLGSYNKRFEPARTPVDWLSHNTGSIDRYLSDPRCTFQFTVGGYAELTRLTALAGKASTYAATPRDLPILIISGACDPVGDFGKGPVQVYSSYRQTGHGDVTLRLYPGDRHEILQELDRDKVHGEVIDWIDAHIVGERELCG